MYNCPRNYKVTLFIVCYVNFHWCMGILVVMTWAHASSITPDACNMMGGGGVCFGPDAEALA